MSTPLPFWEYTIDDSLSCKSNGKKFPETGSENYEFFCGVRNVASDINSNRETVSGNCFMACADTK